MRRTGPAAVLVAVTFNAAVAAASPLAWLGLDPHAPVRDANRLYAEGKYEEATAAYNAALVDRPDSPEVHFNLGDSTYKQGKYEEAVSSFQKVETANDPARASRVAYNVGNATFRQGQALEQSEPQKALELYAQALASYRRGLGLNPDDEDTKFNHELVTQRIAELKKRLEEQKKEQEEQQKDQQQQGDQNQDQQQQDQQQQQPGDQPQDQEQKQEQQEQAGEDQPPKDPQDREQGQEDQPQEPQNEEQQAGGEQPDEPKPPEAGQQPPQADQQPPPEGEPQPAGDAGAGEEKDGELSKGEAAAILDSQRGEEVSPEDVIKKLQGGRVAEPAQDW